MDKFDAGTGVGQDSVLEVRVELVDSEPEIWRRFELRGSLTLSQVHQVLQAAFGWEHAHLHRFVTSDPFAPLRPVDGDFPEVPQWLPGQECEEPGDRPEEDCSLDQLLALGSGGAFYEYDFGDSWLHRLELVSRRPADEDSPPARLIDGARRGPLEDSGGFPGYEAIMDALADPAHPGHAEHSAWVAGIIGSDAPFDPAFLDIPAVNRALTEQFWVRESGESGTTDGGKKAPLQALHRRFQRADNGYYVKLRARGLPVRAFLAAPAVPSASRAAAKNSTPAGVLRGSHLASMAFCPWRTYSRDLHQLRH